MRCVIGVDLGGTNVRAGAFYEDGSPAGQVFSQPSKAQEGTDAILLSLGDTICAAIEAAQIKPESIGIAIPGHIDDVRGVVRWAPNFGKLVDGVFQNWLDVPIREPLSRRTNIPMTLANDANAAALGEYRYGSGKNRATCLVMFTLGTGVGGGVVLASGSVHGVIHAPVVLLGGNKGGAELGHSMITHGGLDCTSGSYGALEAYCQRDAIVRRAVHRLQRGRTSSLRDLCKGDLSAITPLMLTEAAQGGDDVAIEVWTEVGTYLGVGIATMINIFAPEVVAVGGQIAKAGELILGPARKAAINVAIPSLFADTQILQAEQIDDAGMLGAAALAAGILT